MKKSLLLFLAILFGLNYLSAQNTDSLALSGKMNSQNYADKVSPLSKKGQMFVFWGWNRAAFTHSDIHFQGNGYDFTLFEVKREIINDVDFFTCNFIRFINVFY